MRASEDDYVFTGPQLSLVRAGLAPSVWACNRMFKLLYPPVNRQKLAPPRDRALRTGKPSHQL